MKCQVIKQTAKNPISGNNIRNIMQVLYMTMNSMDNISIANSWQKYYTLVGDKTVAFIFLKEI